MALPLYTLLLVMLLIRNTNRNICIAPFLLEAAAEVIMAAVHGADAALAGHEVVAVFGFDLVAADVTADRVANDHSCSSSSCFRLTPTRTPSTNPDRWWSLQRVQIG